MLLPSKSCCQSAILRAWRGLVRVSCCGGSQDGGSTAEVIEDSLNTNYDQSSNTSPIPMKPALIAVLAALPLLAIPALARQTGAEPPAADAAPAEAGAENVQSIQVNGLRDPEWKPYRSMLKGVDAFEEKHKLAPGAALRFVVRPVQPGQPMDGLTLKIVGNSMTIPVPLAADATFTLPVDRAAAEENAEIVLNRKKNLLRWRPDIHTPGVPANMRRLGDLRLECEIRWAVERDELPFVRRNLFRSLGGPCRSSMVNVIYEASAPLSGVTLTMGDRSLPIAFTNKTRRTFYVPLHDASWSDDTLVAFDYAETRDVGKVAAQ
jgi:hypothetical protein